MIRFLALAALTVTGSQIAAARLQDSGTGPTLAIGQGAVWPALCVLLAYCLTQIGRNLQ